jgi:hypothetical protein
VYHLISYDQESESTLVPRIILLVLILLGLIKTYAYISQQPADRRRVLVKRVALSLVMIMIIIFTLMGRLPWISAIIAVLLPILSYLGAILMRSLPRFLPLLFLWLQRRATSSGTAHGDDQSSRSYDSSNQSRRDQMSAGEAREVLGVSDQADQREILLAYRTLMQKVHPDHGGNEYLASKLNQAKDTLLG